MDLETFERYAKVFSFAALPVLVAFGGWQLQDSLAERSVAKDYVQPSVSILNKPTGKTDLILRKWAVDLLNEHSIAGLRAT